MKNRSIKKALGIAMMTAMIFSMAVPAAAQATDLNGSDKKITITNDQAEDLTYYAYEVFKGDVAKLDGNIVISNPEWGDNVNSAKLLEDLKDLQINGAKPFASAATAKDVVEIISPLQDSREEMQAIATVIYKNLTGSPAGTSTQSGNTYTISGLNQGYYLVVDDNGLAVADGRDSKYVLILVSNENEEPDEIVVKTDVPSQEKKVKENQSGNYTGTPEEIEKYGEGFNDVADYNINDVVPFEIISTVPNFKGMDSYYYEFVDTMDDAFAFDNTSVVVTIDGAVLAPSNYTLQEPGYNGATFSVIIDDLMKVTTEDKIGKEIKITFSATLTEKAIIGKGNYNKSKLRYGNNPNEQGKPQPKETPDDEVVVFTYELDVTKFDGDDAQKMLKDAEFIFQRASDEKYVVIDANGKVKEWVDDKNNASTLVSDEKGEFMISGLDEGVYYLIETKAPTGYNLLPDPIRVEIIATTKNGHNGTAAALEKTEVKIDDHDPVHTGKDVGYEAVPVANKSGVELPSTGGMGTTMFYMIGGVLLVGAGVLLVSRKRMNG